MNQIVYNTEDTTNRPQLYNELPSKYNRKTYRLNCSYFNFLCFFNIFDFFLPDITLNEI